MRASFVAERLGDELGLAFDPDDIAMTAGAFAAIMVAFRLLLDAGDEAVYSEPAWFCYEPMLAAADAVPVKVPLKAPSFDLDLAAIEAAIGPKTRLVIVNSPHNPTGRIYDRAMLQELAELLDRASARFGRRIFLLSDEPYRRLRFDGRGFVSPAALYPWTLISYSYGKVTLAPGQRLGYLAMSPLMPARRSQRASRRDVRRADGARLVLPERADAARRSRPRSALHRPERARVAARPADEDAAPVRLRGAAAGRAPSTCGAAGPPANPDMFWNALADRDVFVMPGAIMNAPGYFRICLTASDAMVERALPAFAAVGELAGEGMRKAS